MQEVCRNNVNVKWVVHMYYTFSQDLQEEIEKHREMYMSLNNTGFLSLWD